MRSCRTIQLYLKGIIQSSFLLIQGDAKQMRRLMLSKTMNTRDLGGYPTDSGKITTYRKFIRSDVPFEVSNQDIELLLNNSINTVIDLRNNEEVARKPCALKNINSIFLRT